MKLITTYERDTIQQIMLECKKEKKLDNEFSMSEYISLKFQEKFGTTRSEQLIKWLTYQKEIQAKEREQSNESEQLRAST